MNRFYFTALSILLYLSIFYTSNSQTFFAGKIAGGITNITDSKESIGPKFGIQLGGVMTHNFNNWFGIQSELLYSIKGAKSDGSAPVEFNFNYLEIPIFTKFKVGTFGNNFSRVNLNIGIYNGIKLSGDVKIDGVSYDANGLESYDLGLLVGTDFFVTRNICLDLRYNLGLTEITNAGLKNIGILFGISYYFE